MFLAIPIFIAFMNDHELFVLPNGIRLLYKFAPDTVITHCCLIINAGARDEADAQQGLAHFIEHLLFKGTHKRRSYQVLNRLEVVGGDLNAYTTKEQTCIHASVLNEYTDRALELIADITFNSSFPANEMDKEKGVIIDEIDSYKDMPEEMIQDELDELIFTGHTLANPILGTAESVTALQQADISAFIKSNYAPSEIVIGLHSSLSFVKVKKMAEHYFAGITGPAIRKQRTLVPVYKPQNRIIKKNIHQAHALLGTRAYDLAHTHKMPMLLINNILGGGMSSKLNLNIREKYGIAYAIESNYSPMSDTGFFSIYMGTDKEKVERCLRLVKKELKQLRDTSLTASALQQAKQRFIGQIALAEESRLGVILAMCKNILDYNKTDSLPEIYAKINAITAKDLLAVANEVLEEQQLSLLMYLPE